MSDRSLIHLHEQPTTRGNAARRGFSFSRSVHAFTLALLLSCLTSCSGPKNFLNSNDDLRRENLALKRKAEELQKLLDQRLKQIEAMEQSPGPATKPAVTGVRPMDLPRVVDVSFDSFTGTIDTNSDDIDDTKSIQNNVSDVESVMRIRDTASYLVSWHFKAVVGSLTHKAFNWSSPDFMSYFQQGFVKMRIAQTLISGTPIKKLEYKEFLSTSAAARRKRSRRCVSSRC